MQQLTSVIYQTSEQHKDVSQARQTWGGGTADSETLMSSIEWRSSFDADPSLRDILSSISSRRDVNVDHAKKIIVAILLKYVGFLQEESESYNYWHTCDHRCRRWQSPDRPCCSLPTAHHLRQTIWSMLWRMNSVTITSFVGRKGRTQQLADGIWSTVPLWQAQTQTIKYVLDGVLLSIAFLGNLVTYITRYYMPTSIMWQSTMVRQWLCLTGTRQALQRRTARLTTERDVRAGKWWSIFPWNCSWKWMTFSLTKITSNGS